MRLEIFFKIGYVCKIPKGGGGAGPFLARSLTNSADDIFRCIFLGALRVNYITYTTFDSEDLVLYYTISTKVGKVYCRIQHILHSDLLKLLISDGCQFYFKTETLINFLTVCSIINH